MGVVDVRDVARAHIQAGFTPEASGRHIVSAGEITLLEIGRILREHFGNRYPFPQKAAPKFLVYLLAPLLGITRAFVKKNVGYHIRFDNTYSIKDLNLSYRSFKETVVDHFQQLVDDGLVPKK
jgi:nucleoside-diphosphate-sugar epimerase